MNDRLAFLRAIRANPDDDTARLVFADWLDEHDDPSSGPAGRAGSSPGAGPEAALAEFIRVQIELEPIRYRIDNPRALELHSREEELLRAHSDIWLGEAKEIGTNWPEYGPQFRRGLPNHANLSLDTLLKHGKTLFSACPTLRELSVFGIATRGAELPRARTSRSSTRSKSATGSRRKTQRHSPRHHTSRRFRTLKSGSAGNSGIWTN